jgi:hypothetical protein
MNYTSGQSMLILQTGVMAAGHAGLIQRVGYFDDNNGLYFEKNNTTLSVTMRNNASGSVVNTTVNQANWNIDKLDGTGASGITLDTTKDNIYIIDFQWLGAGRVRFGFSFGGTIVYTHQFDNAGVNTTSYMATGCLPIRQEIRNAGEVTPSVMNIFCLSCIVEGNNQAGDQQTAIDTDGLKAVSTSTYSPIMAVRLKSSANRGSLVPKNLSIMSTTNDDMIARIYIGSTVTGGTWIDPHEHSILEYNTTFTYTGGHLIAGCLIAKNGTDNALVEDTFLSINSDIDGVSDILVVGCKSLSSSGFVSAAMTFEEIF